MTSFVSIYLRIQRLDVSHKLTLETVADTWFEAQLILTWVVCLL